MRYDAENGVYSHADGRVAAQAAAAADRKWCPALYRVGCGCSEPFRCVLRFGARVTLDDCRRCLESDRRPHDR